MMSPKKLFFRRLSSELKFQFSVWKTIIDWTVALYIVIPAIALGINQYLLWWQDPPYWLNLLPVGLLFAIFFFFAWSGKIRIFLREGDQLFLLYEKQWLKQIIKYGLIYSFSLNFLLSMFFVLFLAPFILQHYQFSQIQLISLFFITFLSKVFLGLTKQLLTLRFYGWRQFVVVRGLMVLGSLLFATFVPNILNDSIIYMITILILFIAIGMLSIKRLNYKGSFFVDVAREQSEKLKYVSFLLGFSGVNIKKPRKQRKRPWLFSRSNLIFKKRNAVNGLAELCIKSTLRNGRSLSQYLQFVLICILFIMGIPCNLKWLIWLVFAFVFINFVGLYWKESLASEFIELFYWNHEDKHLALRKFLFIMTLPGFLLISITAGFQVFSWLGALLILPVSIGLVFYLCRIVAFYLV
ncbi:Bacterial ABC transporter protein EcsB [Pelotomaculum sp. FP]|uniref:ABC transporter permease n=1 Tax=Pelotomaculum sp. FP TaxID=261474 RepID=UPI0010646B59|nr:ABC transporter permease [Pelotomaculum sp. FP]TEB14697.1 Bacterial ABC transporter protein EcsB [Pelotomaculum sp. FP]